ncbi:hypothetical protein [Phreatobacter cathodiphilus]|uniref:Flagellar basal-body protein FlbY n=1 Tax=Phreatobacter cathodiphilus TaxID=1868589 RepID=A0A2S0NBZ8_9HYPH|nr:hypothetical protein [Phreatobacter cathodiphilus]AVO45473.1 hypothetical protein C6569_10585 [Phreatobacter cathodiphilus]
MQQPTARPAPPPFASAAEAVAFVDGLRGTMAELRSVLAEETALVRAARIKAARPFELRKTELSHRYLADLTRLKLHGAALRAHAGAALDAVEAEHAVLQEALQVNLAVLATAHAVAEGIIRHVSQTVQARRAPAGYGANGRAHAPAPRASAPMALVRSL